MLTSSPALPALALDPWPDWRLIRDVASVFAVTAAAISTVRGSMVKDHDKQDRDARDVAAMARGDKSALAALYDRYSPVLMAIGARILGDRREAEDLVHDVFIEAWSASASYDPGRGAVSTWLILRMRSRALDRIRSASRSRTVVTEDPVPAATAVTVSADHHLGADRVAVRSALDDLPPEQRRVLELGYFGGLSSSEIAAEIGVSIGTVKSRTAAALSKLRLRLGGDQ